jgi:hypothetical protein
MTKHQAATAALAALAALLLASPAVAHEAPDPRDYETRLLHDWNDDCGGDGGGATGACRGSLDLIALDLQERHDAALGHLAVFRFILDEGAAGAQRVTLALDAGGARTFELRTSDGRSFTGTGFDRVGGAVPLGDGTRFAVEAVVKASSLGGTGATLSGFRLEAHSGAGRGDLMPGGCQNTVGDCIDAGRSDSQYVRPSYALRGPGYYVSVAAPNGARADGSIVELAVRNELRRSAQALTLSVSASAGLQAVFHDAAGQERPTLEVPLAGAQSTTVHVLVRGGASGTVTVEAASDLGGRTVATFPVAAGGEGTGGPAATTAAPTTQASPAAGTLLPALALALVAWRRLGRGSR